MKKKTSIFLLLRNMTKAVNITKQPQMFKQSFIDDIVKNYTIYKMSPDHNLSRKIFHGSMSIPSEVFLGFGSLDTRIYLFALCSSL